MQAFIVVGRGKTTLLLVVDFEAAEVRLIGRLVEFRSAGL